MAKLPTNRTNMKMISMSAPKNNKIKLLKNIPFIDDAVTSGGQYCVVILEGAVIEGVA